MAQHRMGLYNPGASVFGRNPPPVIYGGSEEQIQKYVVPTLKNAWYTFFAITEPSGGSDPAGSIQCRAVRKGDTYVLNGTKIFISHAHEAEWASSSRATDPKAGRGGINLFSSSIKERRDLPRVICNTAHGRIAQRSSLRRLRHSGRAAPRRGRAGAQPGARPSGRGCDFHIPRPMSSRCRRAANGDRFTRRRAAPSASC